MNNLRIIVKADGERVLQYLNYYQDENEVRLCGWQDVPVHEEQSGKIPQGENPTAKPREFWIDQEVLYPIGGDLTPYRKARLFENKKSDIHLVELPKGSRVISREELMAAWRLCHAGGGDYETITKILGLDE